MSISKKGKRAIDVDGRLYYWYVKMDEYTYVDVESLSWGDTVCIVSEDKGLELSYLLGSDFIAMRQRGKYGCLGRFRCPVWTKSSMTPKIVREIILWTLDDKKTLIAVDYRGRVIEA